MCHTFAVSGIYDTFDTLLFFIKSRMILQYKLTLLMRDLYFQCSICDKLQLKEKVFFTFENRVCQARRYY